MVRSLSAISNGNVTNTRVQTTLQQGHIFSQQFISVQHSIFFFLLFLQMKTPRKCRSLGLLDMYGFEALDTTGGFEQLVFNFATEKIQNVITERTLVIEQQEYSIEGVEWTNFDPITDNNHVVTLIERGSFGVFSILDEVCMTSNNLVMQPQTSSVTNSTNEDAESGTSTPSLMQTVSPADIFLEKLAERFGNNPCLEVRLPGGYSTNTTAPASSDTTTTGGDCSTPEVTGGGGGGHQPHGSATKKATETNTKLPHHCFRYG